MRAGRVVDASPPTHAGEHPRGALPKLGNMTRTARELRIRADAVQEGGRLRFFRTVREALSRRPGLPRNGDEDSGKNDGPKVRTVVVSGTVTGEGREECPAQKTCAARGADAFALCFIKGGGRHGKTGRAIHFVRRARVERPKSLRRVRLGNKDEARQKQGPRSAQAHACAQCFRNRYAALAETTDCAQCRSVRRALPGRASRALRGLSVVLR